jgi:flagellar basal-body rod protein FlgC
MNIDALMAVTRQALDVERLRIEASAQRIAMANTALGSSEAERSAFARAMGIAPGEMTANEMAALVRTVHDPTHPQADEQGMVRYPRVDLAQEMTGLLVSSRAYEANVRAFNVLRAMTLSGLEIGGRR